MPTHNIYLPDAEEVRCCLEAGIELGQQRDFIKEMKSIERKINKEFKKANKKRERYMRVCFKWLSESAIEILKENGWDVYRSKRVGNKTRDFVGYIVTNKPRD